MPSLKQSISPSNLRSHFQNFSFTQKYFVISPKYPSNLPSSSFNCLNFPCTQAVGSISNHVGEDTYHQLRARRALMMFKHVPLRTRRALSLYKVYGNSALLVLNRTSLNSINTLLALSRRYSGYYCKIIYTLSAKYEPIGICLKFKAFYQVKENKNTCSYIYCTHLDFYL